jgi:hypothetical protein
MPPPPPVLVAPPVPVLVAPPIPVLVVPPPSPVEVVLVVSGPVVVPVAPPIPPVVLLLVVVLIGPRLPSVGGEEQLVGAIASARTVEAVTVNSVARGLIVDTPFRREAETRWPRFDEVETKQNFRTRKALDLPLFWGVRRGGGPAHFASKKSA